MKADDKNKELAGKIATKGGKREHVNLPGIGMGGKYKGMEFVRGAKGQATYLGMKRQDSTKRSTPLIGLNLYVGTKRNNMMNCTNCNGIGLVNLTQGGEIYAREVCPVCNGTGAGADTPSSG